MNACSALVLIDECSKYEKERHKGNFLVLIIVNSLRSNSFLIAQVDSILSPIPAYRCFNGLCATIM